MSWFDEFLVVLAHSSRTQWAIGLGLVSFIATLVLGNYLVSHLSFQGILSPLAEAVREALRDRYDKAAWSSLGAFFLVAVKCYRKDRKRLLAL